MSLSLGIATAALTLAAQPLPDQLDILRGGDTTPQIQLLLDSSGSMASGAAPSVCSHYPMVQSNLRGSYQSGGIWYLSRTDQLKAALTGCRASDDGILDTWAERVAFSIREFGGSRTGLLAAFDPSLENLTQLESAVLGLPASGTTPLAPAYRRAAIYFDDFFNDGNTARCRQNYLVVMSDGVGNSSGPVDFDFVAGQPSIVVHDANYCFGNVTPGCPPEPYLDAAAGYLFADASGRPVDVLSAVEGTQPLRTYTIGFQAPTAADALLRAMASQGDGQAFTATSYEQLSAAFQQIISSIVARSRVAFGAGTVEADRFFSGSYLYVSVFRPTEDGHWIGTTKKLCVLSDAPSGCLFIRDGSGEGFTINLQPIDVWTGSNRVEADAGGSGQVMLEDIFGVADVTEAPPADALDQRTLLTWRSGTEGYVEVQPGSLEPRDTWTGEMCHHRSLLNALHGFSEEVRDCEGGDFAPVTFDRWPIGDTVNGGTVLLQYTPTCENGGDRCFAVTAANDGMLHFYDARTGRETSAVIPAELWRPNTIAHHRLRDRSDQPSIEATRRYYFDGTLALYHEDADADRIIEPDEEAYLIASLGRGGRAYYLFDVRSFSGVPTDADNAPRPLFADEATGFRELRDTWSVPWTGRMEVAPGQVRAVAVFASGHIPELDAPLSPFGGPAPPAPLASLDSEASPFDASCADVGIPSELCETPDPSTFCGELGLTGCAPGSCSACPLVDDQDCQDAGFSPPYCYDWPGLDLLPDTVGVWANYPLDFVAGPFRYDGPRPGLAYRVRFSRFDLQPGDFVAFYDASQREIGRLSGSMPSAASPWIYDRSFTMRLVTDGINDVPALGYAIGAVEVIRSPEPPPPTAEHHPSVYIVDLARWNTVEELPVPSGGSHPAKFSAPPIGSDARQAGALRVRITRVCSGAMGPDELCIDETTSPSTADLRWMVCPISAAPAVYTEGGLLSSIYVGDECGQIWAAKVSRSGEWSVRRLLRLNAPGPGGAVVSGGASKDYRKIFEQLEVVVSTCPGQRALGVYFGTGNIQRPAAEDALEDPAVSGHGGSIYGGGRNVVGVVWDTSVLPAGASLDDLLNVTTVEAIASSASPEARNGWYIELGPQERMLRAPLVFDGVAYFDVYRPTAPPSECISATGESRTLAMDNCTAAPLPMAGGMGSPDEARTVSRRPDSTIGGGFLVLTPAGEDPIISLGYEARGSTPLPRRTERRSVRLYLWRP